MDNTIELSAKEKAWLLVNPKITMVVPKNFPRSYLDENGKLQGIDIDYFNLIEKKLGIKFDKTILKWHNALKRAMNHEVDLIINAGKLKDREPYLNFSKTYFATPQAIVADENELEISDINDLCGKKIAVHKGSSRARFLQENYPCIKLLEVTDKKDLLSSVVMKNAYAGFDNFDSLSANIKRMMLPGLKIIYFKYMPPIGFARVGIRKDKPILTSIIDKAISSISVEEKNKIISKWLNVKLPPMTKEVEQQKKVKLSSTEEEYLKNNKFTYAGDPNWLPFEAFNESGKYIGIISDHIDIIEKKLDLKFKKIITKNWLDTLKLSKNVGVDIISGDAADKVLAKNYRAIDTYIKNPLVIVTRDDYPFIVDLNHLKDKKIAFADGAGYGADIEKKYPKINFLKCRTPQNGIIGVKSGKYDIFIGTLAMADYTIVNIGMEGIKISGDSGITMNLTLFVNKNKPLLYSSINKTMNSIDDAQKIKIVSKWRHNAIEKIIVDYTLVWQILTISFIIILVILIFYQKLKKLHKKIKILNDNLEQRVNDEVEKNRQQQLLMLHQSRLAQMGEMISMIAHQWRQPLNSLAMLNQAIVFKSSRDKLDEKFLKYFKTNSNKQIQNMSKTIDDFRDFFKPEKEKVEFVINDVIDDTLSMIKPIFKTNEIEIIFNNRDKFKIISYPNELGQAILNIVNNAKDALVEKGIDKKKITIQIEKNNANIVLTISDNAGGIAHNLIDKIFDPYFSTKKTKDGTGLGLYMTKIIIQEHMKGELSVLNDDNGAVFSIVFPL